MTVADSTDAQAATPAIASANLLPRRFVLRILYQDITETDADCLVVNHYAGPHVTGAADDVDKYVNGAIRHAAARGELVSPTGGITFVPARRSPMIADVVAILSMGEYEEFTKLNLDLDGTEANIATTLQRFGRNMAIACCDAEQRDVATVAHGAGDTSQIDPKVVAQNLIIGYWQGLQESAKEGASYSLILVEHKAEKCLQLVEGVKNAVAEKLAADLTMHRVGKCALPRDGAGAGDEVGESGPVGEEQLGYAWIGNLDPTPSARRDMPPPHLRLGIFQIMPRTLKMTVFGDSGADQAVEDKFQVERIEEALERFRLLNQLVPPYINRLKPGRTSEDDEVKRQAEGAFAQVNVEVMTVVESLGRVLYDQIFNDFGTRGIRALLDLPTAENLLLRLDPRTVSIPWELMADEDGPFGLTRQVGRQMELPTMARDYMIPRPARDRVLRMLLVSNPTDDLPGVEHEAKRIVKRLRERRSIEVEITHLYGDKFTPNEVLRQMRRTDFDVFHFAGHARLDPLDPSQSGLVMAGDTVLTVDSISRISNLPGLIFFNACESADTVYPIPEKYAAELRAMKVLGKEMDPLSKRGSNGTGSSNGSSNGKPRSAAGQPAVASADSETDAVVNRFFGKLSVSMVSTLLRAGITNFVGTTWPVDDKAAAEFAVGFYAHVADGGTVGAAMQEARKYVIKRLGYGHLGWASYVLYGVPWNRIV